VDHVRSEWHVTRIAVTWDFRGGGRMTWRGKSRGDGWDRYTVGVAKTKGLNAKIRKKGYSILVEGLHCWVNWAFTSSLPISVFAVQAFH